MQITSVLNANNIREIKISLCLYGIKFVCPYCEQNLLRNGSWTV